MTDVIRDDRTARWRSGLLVLALVQAGVVLAQLAPQAPVLTALLPAFALGYVVGVSRERAPGRWWFALAPVASATVVVVVLVGRYVLDAPAAWWVAGAVLAAAPAVVVAATARSAVRSRV